MKKLILLKILLLTPLSLGDRDPNLFDVPWTPWHDPALRHPIFRTFPALRPDLPARL